MKLYITESKTTIETETEVQMDIDISKIEVEERENIFNELIDSMTTEEIAEWIRYNDRIIPAILVDHCYIPDKEINHMVYLLEGDMEPDVLKKELEALIEKYNIKE